MQRPVSQRLCAKLMADLLQQKAEYDLLDISSNQKFFQDLQANKNKWNAIIYLEAKGFISLDLNPVTRKLLRIHVNSPGLTYFEDRFEANQVKHSEWVRYIITTIIAIAALVKSFMPEITALLKLLWPES